jgi:rhodanese-related sulfurtransferase
MTSSSGAHHVNNLVSLNISKPTEKKMRRSLLTAALLAMTMLFTSLPAFAEDKAVVEAMESYMDFVDYGGATIFPEQIPKDDWKNFFVIDARDSDQFLKDHIPGAVNIEWRRALAERSRIPKDKPVLLYCNTGSLSAQAGFALRVAGFENVRILQGGFAEWKAKGGMDAATRATGTVKH